MCQNSFSLSTQSSPKLPRLIAFTLYQCHPHRLASLQPLGSILEAPRRPLGVRLNRTPNPRLWRPEVRRKRLWSFSRQPLPLRKQWGHPSLGTDTLQQLRAHCGLNHSLQQICGVLLPLPMLKPGQLFLSSDALNSRFSSQLCVFALATGLICPHSLLFRAFIPLQLLRGCPGCQSCEFLQAASSILSRPCST